MEQLEVKPALQVARRSRNAMKRDTGYLLQQLMLHKFLILPLQCSLNNTH